MSKPSDVVSWAFDATVTTGPETGQPTILEPSSGFKGQGWIAEEEAPARYQNWLLHTLGLWSQYLDGITTDPDFVGSPFTWTGLHTFTTAPVFPAGFTAAGFVATPGDIGLGGTTNEIIYTNNIGVPALRSRQELVVLPSGHNSGNVGGTENAVLITGSAPSYWYWPTTSGQVTFPLHMPRGATIDSVRIGVSNQSGGSAAMTCALVGKGVNKTTPSLSSAAGIGSGGATVSLAAAADHVFTVTVTAGTITVNNSVTEFYLVVDGQVGCRIHWVELNYQDPGPRNG